MTFDLKKISRQQLVLLGGVSVVALAVGVRLIWSGPKSAPAATVTATPAIANMNPPPLVKAPVAVVWPGDVARDPFHSDRVFPPATPVIPPKVDNPVIDPTPSQVDLPTLVREKIHLKGTILGERPIAMMNGRVYRTGEVVEGFKIVEIEKNQITVERDGSRFVIMAN